jgi:hypothetical protein
MEVSDQFHALATLPAGKPSGIHLIGGSMDSRPGSDVVEKRKIHSFCRDSSPERPSMYKFVWFSLFIHLGTISQQKSKI